MRAGTCSWRLFAACTAVLPLLACAGTSQHPVVEPGGPAAKQALPTQVQTLTLAYRIEPNELHVKVQTPGASGDGIPKHLFNAALVVLDGAKSPRPQLAEALPELNSPTWRVFPDGRMETTYKLRPGLMWHDSQPLTAEDFVFAWRAYTSPRLTMFIPKPQEQMEEVLAPDERTVLIRWRSPYPEADMLADNFPPFPRHRLEPAFERLEQEVEAADAFLRDRYWTLEYVGMGPFRLERWTPGSSLEGTAFEAYALGRPKIGRVIARILLDWNTVLASLLAEDTHIAMDYTLYFEHMMVLKREWGDRKGSVLLRQQLPTLMQVQFRPEFLKTPALMDLKVRKALAHAIDRHTLRDGLFEGEGIISETFVSPEEPYFRDVERAITNHAYDPRRTEQLMHEAGFTRDREGLFTGQTGDRFRPDQQTQAGSVYERGQAILMDAWRHAGIDAQASVLPVALVRDNEARHTFPDIGMTFSGGFDPYTSAQIGTAAKRWVGRNRGGWSSAEYDRLWDAHNSTLDKNERLAQMVQMAKLASDQLPVFMLYFDFQAKAHLAALTGPEAASTWNIHRWELR